VPTAALNDVSVRAIKPPASGQTTYWDSTLKGFGIRVSRGGAKSWVVMSGAKRKRTTLARYPEVPLKDARVAAKKVLAAPPDLTRSVTLNEAISLYLKHCEGRTRERTLRSYRYTLNRHFKEQSMRLRSLTTEKVLAIVDGISETPSEQLHFFLVAKTFFRFCIIKKLLVQSPLEGLPAPSKRTMRDRVLSDHELKAVWLTADQDAAQLSRIIQICILTGQRRGEISQLRWNYMKERTITLPSSITKNHKQHMFPYGPMLEEALARVPSNEGYLFPGRTENECFWGWSRGKQNFDKLCPLNQHWQLHDLRRVFYTNMAALGIAPHVCARLVNHSSGIEGISAISAVYNKFQYFDEMRKAIELWENKLESNHSLTIFSDRCALTP
jgi:integrase